MVTIAGMTGNLFFRSGQHCRNDILIKGGHNCRNVSHSVLIVVIIIGMVS